LDDVSEANLCDVQELCDPTASLLSFRFMLMPASGFCPFLILQHNVK
jgi:hypothetical protein